MKEAGHITQSYLHDLLDYDVSTATFRWKVTRGNGIQAGSLAGGVKKGRWVIQIDGRKYFASRLAFLHVYGVIPALIDHADGNPLNDRLSNLRPADWRKNAQNRKTSRRNTLGLKGVCGRPTSAGRYPAQIDVNGRRINLGVFDSPEEAHDAYVRAAKDNFGEFARAS